MGRVNGVGGGARYGGGKAVYARCPDDAALPCGANELVSDAGGTGFLGNVA